MLAGFVPYPPDLIARYRAKGYWQDRPLIDHFREAFARYADRVAIVSGGERVTYRQLGERVDLLALHLLELGLKPLDSAVMHLPNIPEFVYLYLAFQRIGVIPLMALPPHRQHEIGHFVDFIDAEAYVIPDHWGGFNFPEMAMSIRDKAKTLKHILVTGSEVPDACASVSRWLATEPSLPSSRLDQLELDPLEPCTFQLSGGTTGIPKVIARTHNDYVYNSKASGAVIDIHPDDALLVVLPIAHNFPLASAGIQAFLLQGARIVLSTTTRPADVMPLIERERITHLEIVPALIIRWLDDPDLGKHDLSSVRVVNSGGQKYQPETKVRTEEIFSKAKVQEVFGMAEGLLMYSRLEDSREARIETVGRPVCPDDEVLLVDDDGHEVPVGELGELWVRGPYTLRGYYRAPEHNARTFTPDGFYKSGDVLRKRADGNYIVEGRLKDVINRGGEKISAEEVENLLLMHPAIHNVACVPMPDRVLGEKMCAFAILRPGRSITLADMTAFLNEHGLARYKHPERLEIIAELPISGFGKVQKNVLTAQITEKLKAESSTAAGV
ncbi:MAG TPA: AMP-binding protein [Chloroflexota bacterium]|nr:AMP-binding protein [Chloroflexota bacterium]